MKQIESKLKNHILQFFNFIFSNSKCDTHAYLVYCEKRASGNIALDPNFVSLAVDP